MDWANTAYFVCLGVLFLLFVLSVIPRPAKKPTDNSTAESGRVQKLDDYYLFPTDTMRSVLLIVLVITIILAIIIHNWFGLVLWSVVTLLMAISHLHSIRTK